MRRRTLLHVDRRRCVTLPVNWADRLVTWEANSDGSITLRPLELPDSRNTELPDSGITVMTHPTPLSIVAPPAAASTDGGSNGEIVPSAAVVVVRSKALSPSKEPQEKQSRQRAKPNDKTVLWTEHGFEVPEALRLSWVGAYPGVDITSAIRRAYAWAKANPERRKKNWGRFLVNWLAREQERGGSYRGPPAETMTERAARIEAGLKARRGQ